MWRLEEMRDATRKKQYPTESKSDLAALPQCCILPDGDDDDFNGVLSRDAEENERLLQIRADYWKAIENKGVWEVPLGRDLDAMPWLSRRGCGVLEAIERARRQHCRTALLVDNSADKVVDTFFLYRPVQVLEAKAMVIEERTGKRNRPQILEQARIKLVNAMRYGQTLYVRMSNTATQFVTTYSGPTTLPLAIFDQSAVGELQSRHSGPSGENLFGSNHSLAGALREEDTEFGFFVARHGFEVVVSTHLEKSDFMLLLQRALPMDMLQPILPTIKQRKPDPLFMSEERAAEEEGAAVEGAEVPDEDQPWTLDDAAAAAVRLRLRVEAARAARASGGDGGGGGFSSICVNDQPPRRGPRPGASGDALDLVQTAKDAAAKRRAGGSGAATEEDPPPTTIDGRRPGAPPPPPQQAQHLDFDFDENDRLEGCPPRVTRCFASKRDIERDLLEQGRGSERERGLV